MQSYNKYFIPYVPEANINYIYLLSLYGLAERAEEGGIKQDIGYNSIKELLDMINKDDNILSESTLRRMLKNDEYKKFFIQDKKGNIYWIYLLNNFRKCDKQSKSFVVLCPNTYKLIMNEKDNLLAKYIIFMKYMCGVNGGSSDFTANQFLTAFGYTTQSNNMKDKISKYNNLLEQRHIIKIKRNTLEDGKRRNTYTFIDN